MKFKTDIVRGADGWPSALSISAVKEGPKKKPAKKKLGKRPASKRQELPLWKEHERRTVGIFLTPDNHLVGPFVRFVDRVSSTREFKNTPLIEHGSKLEETDTIYTRDLIACNRMDLLALVRVAAESSAHIQRELEKLMKSRAFKRARAYDDPAPARKKRRRKKGRRA